MNHSVTLNEYRDWYGATKMDETIFHWQKTCVRLANYKYQKTLKINGIHSSTCLTFSITETVWRSPRQVCSLYSWARRLQIGVPILEGWGRVYLTNNLVTPEPIFWNSANGKISLHWPKIGNFSPILGEKKLF